MALLLNKYPEDLISKQFQLVLQKFTITEQITVQNYEKIRSTIISTPRQEETGVDYENNLFAHFTFCSNMRTFPIRFHALWKKYFSTSPIGNINPILGTRNVNNLHRRLIHTRYIN